MNKAEMKQIELKDMEIKLLNVRQDICGEYSTDLDIRFMLSDPFSFEVFNQTYVIDRIRLVDQFDELIFSYANESEIFCCFQVSKIFIDKIRKRVLHEQQQTESKLYGWSFEEELIEILRGEKQETACW